MFYSYQKKTYTVIFYRFTPTPDGRFSRYFGFNGSTRNTLTKKL